MEVGVVCSVLYMYNLAAAHLIKGQLAIDVSVVSLLINFSNELASYIRISTGNWNSYSYCTFVT